MQDSVFLILSIPSYLFGKIITRLSPVCVSDLKFLWLQQTKNMVEPENQTALYENW